MKTTRVRQHKRRTRSGTTEVVKHERNYEQDSKGNLIKINPLSIDEVKTFASMKTGKDGMFRVLANGQNIGIQSGQAMQKGTNVIYHIAYWGWPKSASEYVKKILQKNNPNLNIRIDYQKYED